MKIFYLLEARNGTKRYALCIVSSFSLFLELFSTVSLKDYIIVESRDASVTKFICIISSIHSCGFVSDSSKMNK